MIQSSVSFGFYLRIEASQIEGCVSIEWPLTGLAPRPLFLRSEVRIAF